jgi:23S rRNA pseudouridine1911/1915/1917 synthase
VAAVNISSHAWRVSMKELKKSHLPVLLDAAGQISRALGYSGKFAIHRSGFAGRQSALGSMRARRTRHRRLDLLHEDRHVIVVNKPPGLLTIPSGPGRGEYEDTLLKRAREYARHKQGRGAYAGVLHRLDRDTSGALAIALSREAHERGRELFRDHRFERRYLALVHGVATRAEGTIRARISSEYRAGRRSAVGPQQRGRDAVTHYKVVEALGTCSLVELTLETGRQHQIRIHLAELGHPVLGDAVYGPGATRGPSVPRVMLHAFTLAFPHPVTSRPVAVTAPMPRDFMQTIERARRGLRDRS